MKHKKIYKTNQREQRKFYHCRLFRLGIVVRRQVFFNFPNQPFQADGLAQIIVGAGG
jgi:hypothetical protein